MGNAMRVAEATFAAQTNVAAPRLPLTDREAAYDFTGHVVEFSAAELAQAASRTKSAAKGWKDGSRAPSTASIINMARSLPRVREWLLNQIGFDRSAQAGSTDAIVQALYAIAVGEGQEADVARDMIAKLRRPDASIEHDAVIVYLANRRIA